MPKSRVGKGLTSTRGPVHGNFEEGAKITQGVMGILSIGSKYHTLTPGQREAIHMIVHKLHRIVTGNSNHKDHWDDIGGYAQLGADVCEEPVALNALSLKSRRVKRPAAKARAVKKVAARPAKKAKKARKAKARRPAVQRDNLTAANAVGRSRAGARRPRAARPSPALVPEVA